MTKAMNDQKYLYLLVKYRDIYDILRNEIEDIEEIQVMLFLEDLDRILPIYRLTDNLPEVSFIVGSMIGLLCFRDSNNYIIHILETGIFSALVGMISSRVIFSRMVDKLYDNKNYDYKQIEEVLDKKLIRERN